MMITMLYAGVLGLVLLVLAIRVLMARGQTKTHMGDGGNPLVLRRMRGQANFAEYVPMTLLLMALIETHGAPIWFLHALGGTLLLGRLLHGYAFAFSEHFFIGRFMGTNLTFLPLLVSAGACLWYGAQAL